MSKYIIELEINFIAEIEGKPLWTQI